MRNWLFVSFLLVLHLFCTKAIAECCNNPSWISLGAGFLKTSDPRPAFQIETKSPLMLTCIRAQLGFMTEEFHSAYFFGGLGFECEPFKNLVFYPNISPGLYFKGGGVNLGCVIEFRSALELSYQIKGRYRIGSQFFHLSNARLGRRNPGVNGFIFFLSFSQ